MKKYLIWNILWDLMFLFISLDIIRWSHDLENPYEYFALTIGILGLIVEVTDIIICIKEIKK
ncbi:hypothetical protein M5X02_30855, partial [Paenibacillus alvei]